MGSGVSCCRNSSSSDHPDDHGLNNNTNPGDEVSEDPALQKMLECFQLADQAVALNDYPRAIKTITDADQYLTMLSQKHLSEAHLHAMAIAQRKGTYRRMMNQLKEAIEEYEFGLRIGEAKVQKRGTSSQYLLLHLISEISCLSASCHMSLLVACKRILKLREIQHVEDPDLMATGDNNNNAENQNRQNNNNSKWSSSASLTEQKLNKLNDNNSNNNNAAAGAGATAGTGGGSFRKDPKNVNNNNNNNNNNNTSRPPSQLANHNNNNNVHLAAGGSGVPIGVGSTAGAASFGGRMTPQGEESSRMARGAHMRGGDGVITPSRESQSSHQQHQQQMGNSAFFGGGGPGKNDYLGVDGGEGRFVLSRHDRMVRHKKQLLNVKVEDEDMLGAGPTSFSFAQNTSFISRNSDDGGAPDRDDDLEQATVFEKLASRDVIMGPLMHLPSAALEVQENLHAKTAEQALLHSIELIEELQNRQSELLLGPLFRLADLYETLDMMQPCERCVRRLVGISLVKYGHDHDIYIRQHFRLLALANAKEERKTLNAAVMISKTWKMKVQMKRLRAANARTEFEPRRHVVLQRKEPPPNESRAQEVLQQIVGLQEDPPSEYEESEDDGPNFDEDYENYNDDDLVVPGWDANANDQAKKKGLLGAMTKKTEPEKKKSDDPFGALKD